MLVFELEYPGTWLDFAPEEKGREIRNLLSNIESHFTEASLALNWFLSSISRPRPFPSQADWENESNRKREITESLVGPMTGMRDFTQYDEARHQADILFKREQWSKGTLPRNFQHSEAFVFAKAFLYSIDGIDRTLDVIAAIAGVPDMVKKCQVRFDAAFPHLRDVRNTAHHLEDRTRSLDKRRKPIQLQSITNSFINAPGGGVLVLNALNGTKFGSTMADGHYGEVDVHPSSMQAIQGVVQELLKAFSWHGPKSHYPS